MKVIWTKQYFIINGNMGEMRQVCVARKKLDDDMVGCVTSSVRVSERKNAGSLTLMSEVRRYVVSGKQGKQLAFWRTCCYTNKSSGLEIVHSWHGICLAWKRSWVCVCHDLKQ